MPGNMATPATLAELNISTTNIFDISWHYASTETADGLQELIVANASDMDTAWLVLCG